MDFFFYWNSRSWKKLRIFQNILILFGDVLLSTKNDFGTTRERKKKDMATIFENIRSLLEAELFQWNKQEEHYLTTIQELRELNDYLSTSSDDLKKELGSLMKQLDESRNREKKLAEENKKLRSELDALDSVRSKHRWRFFF